MASASPLTGRRRRRARRLEDAGAAAVVLPSLFEEQITHEALDLDRLIESPAESFPRRSATCPTLDDYNAGPDRYLELVEQAKGAVAIPVIASLNGVRPAGWVHYATLIQDAGADAIELNIYYVVGRSPRSPPPSVERRYARAGRRRPRVGRRSRWPSRSGRSSASLANFGAAARRGRARTDWCCSTASTSRTSTSRRWRWSPG